MELVNKSNFIEYIKIKANELLEMISFEYAKQKKNNNYYYKIITMLLNILEKSSNFMIIKCTR